jgi:cellulose synthase (UDP-forming)
VGGTPQTRAGVWWERHPRLVRAVSAVALVWGAAWLTYRFAWSWRGANPLAFIALALVELYNLLALALLAFTGWRWGPPEPAPPIRLDRSIDVFVCTYDEPDDVVEATLAGCAALRQEHTTYLLDDGRRESMRVLAERWGAVWITRPNNAHAKAGNINHALARTHGELIFFLDADHVPLPDALDLTVGHFNDPAVALVQSPHDFYNQDSVQHYDIGRHEQSLFFEVICPGKDRHNAAFWCGSATLVRRRMLHGIGGVATETIAEDFHTTIKMHRNGWKTRYHNGVLVQGLAPIDLDGYLLQRDRWARGNLAVFRSPESPLRPNNGLTPRQRLHYFASLFAYGAGAARLMLFALLTATLAFGVLPARVTLFTLLGLWVPATVFAVLATSALCRGHMRLRESSHYVLLTAAVFTRALRCAFLPSKTKFKVTPKDGIDTGGWHSLRRLQAVLILTTALLAALIWRGLAIAGVVGARTLPGLALPMAVGLGVWEVARAVRTLTIVATRRQRRARYRFPCRLPTVVQTDSSITTGTVLDIAGTGLSISTDIPYEPGTEVAATTSVEDVEGELQLIQFRATVRSCRAVEGAGWVIGAQLSHVDDESWRRLMTFCYVVYPTRQLRQGSAPKRAETSGLNSMDSEAKLEELESAVATIERLGARPFGRPSDEPASREDGLAHQE